MSHDLRGVTRISKIDEILAGGLEKVGGGGGDGILGEALVAAAGVA